MRKFILFIILSAYLSGCSEKQSVEFSSSNFELVKLADGVYGCIHKLGGKSICNSGIIDNGKETLIFDTFLSPSAAQELLDVVEKFDLSPIKYVINSHSHNDHIRGNQVFPSEVEIISTSQTAELIKKWEPLDIEEEKKYAPSRFSYYDSLYKAYDGDTTAREFKQILMWRPYYQTLAESHKVIQTRLPNLIIENKQEFNGPDRRVQIISKGQGHTESDLILYLPDEKILFTGDLVFNQCHPYLAHGSLSDWKNYLKYLDSLNIVSVIPGHGQPGSKEILNSMREYILTVENLASEMHNQKLTIDQTEDIEIPEQYKNWWFDQFFLSNLKFAYSTLVENK